MSGSARTNTVAGHRNVGQTILWLHRPFVGAQTGPEATLGIRFRSQHALVEVSELINGAMLDAGWHFNGRIEHYRKTNKQIKN